jgi:hypothetical protein
MSIINWSNVTDLGQLPQLANTASGGAFWPGFLHMIWIVLILVLIGYGFEVALLVGSFSALILAVFMVYSDIVSWIYVVEFSGILLFLYLYITWSGNKGRAP